MRGRAVAAGATGRARVMTGPLCVSIISQLLPGCAIGSDSVLPGQSVLLWGLVLLTSFAGWGGLVAYWITRTSRLDLGLRLAWGVSVVLALGGVACLFSLATRTALIGIVVIGLAAHFWYRWITRTVSAGQNAVTSRRPLATTFLLFAAAFFVGLQYCGGVTGFELTPDDTVSYFAFSEEISATGTLLQPFSLRRMAAYGGQSFLQAFVLIGSSNAFQISSLDVGISIIIVVALVLGGRTRSAVGLWLLPLLLLLTLPDMRANTTSLMSGVALFLGLYRTAVDPVLRNHPHRQAVLIGVVAAGACTLRHSYLPAAVMFVALLYAPALMNALRQPRRGGARDLVGALCVLTMLACLLAWIALSVRASGTPLYPLLRGHARAEAGDFTAGSLADRVRFLWTNMIYCEPVRSVPLFLLAALTFPWRSSFGALSALAWASLIGFLAICWGFPLSDQFNIARYYFGFVVAMVMAVSIHTCSMSVRDLVALPLRTRLPALLTLTAIVLQLAAIPSAAYTTYRDLVTSIKRPAWLKPGYSNQQSRILAAQSSVPAGASILVMLDQSFWLDFTRNPIHVLDIPGQVSPPPGFPLDNDDAMVSYLASQGIRHVVFVRPSVSDWTFKRAGWEALAGPINVPLWKGPARVIVKFFDRLDGLMQSRAQLYNDGKFVALDLAQRP